MSLDAQLLEEVLARGVLRPEVEARLRLGAPYRFELAARRRWEPTRGGSRETWELWVDEGPVAEVGITAGNTYRVDVVEWRNRRDVPPGARVGR